MMGVDGAVGLNAIGGNGSLGTEGCATGQSGNVTGECTLAGGAIGGSREGSGLSGKAGEETGAKGGLGVRIIGFPRGAAGGIACGGLMGEPAGGGGTMQTSAAPLKYRRFLPPKGNTA
jgi:hypothetical protein